ncbi:hypothetical protein F7725_003737 [Dissostichus mawsoni]|uniref:Epithelial membrane protein 2 n=1 Tax=Dissostichus mawsoni TaxID=36200 RepID=A0A7J5YD09_DISMA|nr:hypothetical protein F7725_003737 [Dissostichus mawsoni]
MHFYTRVTWASHVLSLTSQCVTLPYRVCATTYQTHLECFFFLCSNSDRRAAMLIILAFIILFHVAAAILLFVATIHNAWWVVSQAGRDVIYADLWYSCNSTCFPVENSHTVDAAYLQTIQATMILATILCCVSFFLHPSALQAPTGRRFLFTAIIQLLAALCVMIAASVYTAQKNSFHLANLREGTYGSSYILAWISFPMTLMSGLMYLVLRKRK